MKGGHYQNVGPVESSITGRGYNEKFKVMRLFEKTNLTINKCKEIMGGRYFKCFDGMIGLLK